MILIVDDEASICELVARAAKLCGFPALTAHSQEAALKCFAENERNIVLSVIDYYLAGGSGLALAGTFRKSQPRLPVLFTSGCCRDEIESDVLDDRTVFLQKPYMFSELVEAMKGLISGGDHHDSFQLSAAEHGARLPDDKNGVRSRGLNER